MTPYVFVTLLLISGVFVVYPRHTDLLITFSAVTNQDPKARVLPNQLVVTAAGANFGFRGVSNFVCCRLKVVTLNIKKAPMM